jgi:23S rRNA-/tRNA-specific pseudouridylate synthase
MAHVRRRRVAAPLTALKIMMLCAARVYALQNVAPCTFFNPSQALNHISSIRRFPTLQAAGAARFVRRDGKRSTVKSERAPRQLSRTTSTHHQVRRHTTSNTSSASSNEKLEKPEIIFANNHLLVINKPAGWKSQPGDGGGGNSKNQSKNTIDTKCLLSYLQSQELGGGSQSNFLVPTHRLDQPCTGVLIFAKNGKAASRVQVAWAKRQVKKVYWVVVEGGENGLELLKIRSKLVDGGGDKHMYQLSGLLKSSIGGRGGGGGSVIVKPLSPNHSNMDADRSNGSSRVCHIEWEHIMTLPTSKQSTNTRYLLSVATDTGAKHQVRSLLALAGGTPIAGDLRYGDNNNISNRRGGRVDAPLPDGSVALHARSVFLPSVSLGGMEFLKDQPFVASLPSRWRQYFGISEQDVEGLR